MQSLIIFLICFCFVLIVYILIFKSYIIRQYKFKMYVGKVGSGKTTLLIRHLLAFIKKCERKKIEPIIYCNIDVVGIPIRKYDPNDIGVDKMFDRNSLVVVDEPNLYWDNRDFKTISKKAIQWFRLYRHNQVNIILYSQTYDIDKKLRRLCTDVYLIKKYIGTISVARKLDKTIEITENALDAESQIVDRIKKVPFFIPTATEIYFIPKYSKYYNSFEMQQEIEHIPYLLIDKPILNKSKINKKRII